MIKGLIHPEKTVVSINPPKSYKIHESKLTEFEGEIGNSAIIEPLMPNFQYRTVSYEAKKDRRLEHQCEQTRLGRCTKETSHSSSVIQSPLRYVRNIL